MRHASFFSGVGGLDLGFERAGIETVSVSEIDPYANAVLAERFPDAPNLGSITEVDANDIPEADIWSGGFPCQDLSVAGKRAGFAGKRSSLAFTFLDLVERRRPRWLLLENVPGLFSSNNGADFGRLLYEMEQLGYGVSWRTLDARYFGVAQRRRRVFIVGSLESDRAEQVLFECQGGCGHIEASNAQGEAVASGAASSAAISSAVTAKWAKGSGGPAGDEIQNLTLSASPDTYRMRAANGVARWLDDKPILAYRKSARVSSATSPESWVDDGLANTLNNFDVGDVRTTHAIVGGTQDEDALLPVGLDSHRYRCCGNGVVAPVAEWIGRRIVEVDRRWREKEGK